MPKRAPAATGIARTALINNQRPSGAGATVANAPGAGMARPVQPVRAPQAARVAAAHPSATANGRTPPKAQQIVKTPGLSFSIGQIVMLGALLEREQNDLMLEASRIEGGPPDELKARIADASDALRQLEAELRARPTETR